MIAVSVLIEMTFYFFNFHPLEDPKSWLHMNCADLNGPIIN